MKRFSVCLLVIFLVLIAARSLAVWFGRTEKTPVDWGSFTSEKTYSYDGKYYALQSIEEDPEIPVRMIKVTVHSSDTDQVVAEFIPARARDFWGICWESDTYNIWTQSADIGVFCYTYQDGRWSLDEDAERPPDIVSKYD